MCCCDKDKKLTRLAYIMKLKEAVIKKSNKAIHILGRFRVKIIVIQMITRAHMLMQAGLQYKQYKISIYFVYCFLLIASLSDTVSSFQN